MGDGTNFRRERIAKLLLELEYEVQRGMLEAEIEEEMDFRFVVPISRGIPDGVVLCEFRTRPVPRHTLSLDDIARGGRLKVVK